MKNGEAMEKQEKKTSLKKPLGRGRIPVAPPGRRHSSQKDYRRKKQPTPEKELDAY